MEPADIDQDLAALVSPHLAATGGPITALRQVAARYGHINKKQIEQVAWQFNLSQAEVKGVASFYDDLFVTPQGRHRVRVCTAEACQSVGAGAVLAACEDAAGLTGEGTTADGNITLQPVACLGLCACGPAAMIDGKLLGRVTETAIRDAIAALGE
jgi:formate dehydrogenase subunit gamma